jgi:hypothetical protein
MKSDWCPNVFDGKGMAGGEIKRRVRFQSATCQLGKRSGHHRPQPRSERFVLSSRRCDDRQVNGSCGGRGRDGLGADCPRDSHLSPLWGQPFVKLNWAALPLDLLESCETDGIELKNCPPYIREWITRVRRGK